MNDVLIKFAYFISEADGFSKSSEHYWLEAENTIKGLKETLQKMLYENVSLIKDFQHRNPEMTQQQLSDKTGFSRTLVRKALNQ